MMQVLTLGSGTMILLANAKRLGLEVLAASLDPVTAVADLRAELDDITEELDQFPPRNSKEAACLRARIYALEDRITKVTALFRN